MPSSKASSAIPEVPTGEDEFVELDEDGKPKPKTGAPPPPHVAAASLPLSRRRRLSRRRAPETAEIAAPNRKRQWSTELDDVEPDVAPEEFMARRRAAVAKHKPGTPGAGAPGASK